MNNSSNSFNICQRCGSSNTLNARYCSRCGAQLKVPEEAVVCHKCHTRNAPMANFCRNCGTQLKVGAQTKICPRCNNEVNAEDNVCACGYSFVTISTAQATAPAQQNSAFDKWAHESDNVTKVAKQKKSKQPKQPKQPKSYSNKGGRVFAFFAMLLVAVFAFLVIAPTHTIWGSNEEDGTTGLCLRPDALNGICKGVIYSQEMLDELAEENQYQAYVYGYNFVEVGIYAIGAFVNGEVPEGTTIKDVLWLGYGESMANMILAVLCTVFALCVVIHLLGSIIRLFSGKRSKRANVFYLILAILSGIVVALTVIATNGIVAEGFIHDWFALQEGVGIGTTLYLIPAYFLFFFIYSLISKAKAVAVEQ